MPSSVQEAGDLPRPGGRGEERGLGERWESRKGGGGRGAGQGTLSGPFAEAGTDPQGSLRPSQSPPAGFASPAIPQRGSRRGCGGHRGAWRRALETAGSGGAPAFAGY